MAYELKDVKSILGTFVTIIVVHPETNAGAEAIQSAFAEISRIESLMSVHSPDSEISQLNRNGYQNNISRETKYVLQKSQYYSELSDGAFDITILPVIELWGKKSKARVIPSEEEILEAQKLVGYKNIVIEDSNVWFSKAGMKVTLAGVAKGYAVDRAAENLIKHGIKNALVNAGGDIRCIGGKTESIPWRIAIRNPINQRQVSVVLEIQDKAIATSGAYQPSKNDIIDPRSGRPAEQGILSASVLAESAMDADILTKFIYVPGIKKGKELIRRFSGTKVITINEDGSITRMPEQEDNQIKIYGK